MAAVFFLILIAQMSLPIAEVDFSAVDVGHLNLRRKV
jgi:hypothetical protein